MSQSRTTVETEPPRPSVSGRGPGTTTPTIQDQIRGYRLGSRLQFEAQRRLPGLNRRYQRSLESQMNPDAELSMSQYRRAQQVPAEVLYQAGWSERRHRVYQHYSDERILVTDGQQLEVPFITDESYDQLRQSGLQHIHIGLIMVRLHTLHRRNAGVNALIVIRDIRWRDERAIISSLEMDLGSGTQLAYTAPNMMLSIHDFHEYIQLVIQTHGYEQWQGGESNLLLSRSLIGRLSNTSHTNFRYNVQNVADHLTARGVRAIEGPARSTEDLQGRQWIVRPAIISRVQIPQQATVRSRTDGSQSIKFAKYSTSAPNTGIGIGEADEEEFEEQFINLLTQDEYMPWELEEGIPEVPDDWPWEGLPDFPEPEDWPWELDEEFGELLEIPEIWPEPNDETILGAWFTNILRLEEPTIEYLEPMYPYVWCDQFDDTDLIVQFISDEISWSELVDNERYWHEDALMMTCHWDESEDSDDEREEFLRIFTQFQQTDKEDLLNLLSEGGERDTNSRISHCETIWDEDEPTGESISLMEEMEYPMLRQLQQQTEAAKSTAESSMTRLPQEPVMGPALYPPARSSGAQLNVPEIQGRLNNIRGGYAQQFNERFNLPSAQTSQGAILVLPEDVGLYSDVISRWESITLNLLNERNWADNKAKAQYVENLLGETEKKIWIQWRMAYPTEYDELVGISDDPQNLLSQVRRMFLLEDPTTGSTEEQDRAYNDLERLSCQHVKDLFDYINDYKILAAKSGKMYISPELSVKFFRKMPPIIGSEIEKAFNEKYPGAAIGVIPRIHFTYQYLAEQCHFARDCRNQKGNIARAAIAENLDLADDWDVVSVDQNEADSDAICSFSEGEGGNQAFTARFSELPYEDALMMTTSQETYSWRVIKPLPQHQKDCTHHWQDNQPVQADFVRCWFCQERDGIQMLVGCNFIRAMQGGLRIEGQTITFYKSVTTITSRPDAEVTAMAEIAELDLSEVEYHEIQRCIAYSAGEQSETFKAKFQPLLDRLREQGFIGEDPLKHWSKNQHVGALLKIGVIRPSKSRHRTMAMMVNSGTLIDPRTGAETKGKERMVFNYRTLNDNTHKDQYSLPGINTILKKVGNSKIYSKFDLKSGFHQVAMDPESIEWTAFVVPGGLYEWLVMPFGLKNAPAVFQRKMDTCFKGTENFIAVYIDDILVFSETEEQHAEHLKEMLKRCEKWGLVLSPTKMKIAVPEIEFLGAVIGNRKIKLQPHIIKKIISFDEAKLREKSGLRSWLGILNYARSYIPKLGTLLGPLYSKTSEHGDKRLKPSDYEIIRKIKVAVQNLPDLEIPPEHAYIILETDGCMEGWGGVCKWKHAKSDPRSTERVCAYASGKMILQFLHELVHGEATTFPAFLSTRLAYAQAKRWMALCGENQLTKDYELVSVDELSIYPRSYQLDRAMDAQLKDLYITQVAKTIEELERLIAMSYVQKMRLEQHSGGHDNWFKDALGPVNHKIQTLLELHRQLNLIRQSHIY
ncbi:hypothetical protein LUZ61_001234 [Rhynchospora tenuis]|uniref:Reverse transcriptase domain-containing protein n=1 Tax=Rhynchospora tenuis TaxID=198213 RepID=A0AAD5ZH09_9POAL|nr:hypothetical protein LUZ61_001234 [Rhynchospora tenuis]